MSFYVSEEEPFVRKVEGIVSDALNNNKITLFRFLNEREIELIKYLKKDTYLYFSPGQEYRRVVISPFEITPSFNIELLKIDYNKRYLKLNHRIVLGTLMSLGIKRDTIGDIIITEDDNVYFYATKEISSFIINELRVISHQSVSVVISNDIIGNIKNDYDIKEYFVSSLRLDLLISFRYNLSRKESLDLIASNNCKVNQKPMKNASYIVKESDMISLKGYGRFKLLMVGNTSKSGKIYVKLAKLL